MIHRNPYQLNIKNQKVICDYLVGVATKIETEVRDICEVS